MNIPNTALELSKLLNTSPSNLRQRLLEANGQINFNAKTDELTSEQLQTWLPRYVTKGAKSYLSDETKRATVEAMLLQLNGNGKQNGTPTQHKAETQHKPQRNGTERTTERQQLQTEIEQLNAQLSANKEALHQWTGKPWLLRLLGSSNARATLAFVLASFEFVGTMELLKPKGLQLAIPVAFAMAFALLVFTASENRFGQWFCIAFAFVLGAIYFAILPLWLSDWLFAFVPPSVAAILVNSFNAKK
jgi:cation transport ATPase